MTNNILVVGSMNMDLVMQTQRCPDNGETVFAKDFTQVPGGKGANQALAISKLGGEVVLVSACGRDNYGDELVNSLQNGGVNTDYIKRLDKRTGIANIIVEENASNRIIVDQAANKELLPVKLNDLEKLVRDSKIVLLQMEIPLETIEFTVKMASIYKKTVILDPAPARKLPASLYSKINYLLPNEGELNSLLDDDSLTMEDKTKKLLDMGVGTVLVTQGEDGVSYFSLGDERHYTACKVKAVDTTAAGDSFAGAFALGLQKDWSEDMAIKFAILVAAQTVKKMGAQSSLPDLDEIYNNHDDFKEFFN